MNKKLMLFVMFLLSSITVCFAVLSRNDAEDLLLTNIVLDRVGRVDVYLSNELISINENVACTGYSILTPYNINWVAFIDEAPVFGWTHPCTYVFIDSETGQFQLHQDQRPIRNLSDMDKISSIDYIANNNLVVPASNQTTNRPINEHLYAVLINATTPPTGGSPNYLRFWNELSAMFTTLVHEYGCPRDHIKVLSTDATDANNFGFTHESIQYRGRDLDFRRESATPSVDIQYACNLSNLNSVFSTLGNQTDSDDAVVVFLTGHASYDTFDSVGTYFATWQQTNSEYVSALQFDLLLDNLNDCKQVTIITTPCHSGGYINGCTPITGHNRTVIASVDSDESEPAELWYTPVPSDHSLDPVTTGYGEFAYYFISALRGKFPVRERIGADQILINQPWNDGPPVGSYSFPGFPLTPNPHPMDIPFFNLTANGNVLGDPLLFRAYQYADIWDTVTDQQQMEEGLVQWPNFVRVHQQIGNPNYRAHPQYVSNGCLYRDRQTLDDVNINLSGYQIRDRLSFYSQSLSLNGNLSVSNNGACLSLEDASTLIMTPNSQIDVCDGSISVNNNSILTMQEASTINLDNATVEFDHSRLNMSSSNLNLQNRSSVLFNNISILHAFSGINRDTFITGRSPQLYVENTTNGGTSYANHLRSETLIHGDVIEFRNSIFESRGGTHRLKIKSSIQNQDTNNPILWDGIHFYNCEQDFFDNTFQDVDFDYIDKISFNNCQFTFSQCNISNSCQLLVENNSRVNIYNSNYENNDGPIYASQSAVDIQHSEIQHNRLGGVYLNYPSTNQGYSSILLSTIHDNGLHGLRTSSSIVFLDGTSISTNAGQGIYNFSHVAPVICSGVQLRDNEGSEIFATDAGFPIFNPSGAHGVNQIIDNEYIDNPLDQYYLMALGAPQDGSIQVQNTVINYSNPDRFYPSTNCFTFNNNLLHVSRILSDAINLLAANEYQACMDSLKQIIDVYPDSKEAVKALGILPYVDKAMNDDNTYLLQYLDSISFELLIDAIVDSKILSYIYNKDYISAISNLEAIIQDPPSDYKLLAAKLDEAYCYYLSTIEGKGSYIECTVMPKNRIDYNMICVDLQNQLNGFSGMDNSNPNIVNHTMETCNYPNPFNPTTTISFSIPTEMVCHIEIYNVRGQKIQTLLNETKIAGRHSIIWDGKDANGRSVSSGVYFYRLTTPDRTQTSKMLLMK